jgi:hypothetical protein
MNKRFFTGLMTGLALTVVLSACRTAPEAGQGDAAVPPELLQRSYLFEVVRYLYRWHLDEAEIERIEGDKQLVIWVRRLEPKLDPGDRSLEGEILLPQLQVSAKVKKEDYTIEELGVVDKSPNFYVTRVVRDQVPAHARRGCAVVRLDMTELRDFLFRTRGQHDYPDAALVEHLHQALRKEGSRPGLLGTNALTGEQIFYLAPLSPVANETWVFWEAGRKLCYVASDIDPANPAAWTHEALMVHIYDLDEQVVGSHEEAPGSNRFLTREEVSRVVFNCVVLGQRITVAY